MTQYDTLLVGPDEAAELAHLSHKAVFGRVMDELGERDDSLTVVVSDYGRRLNLGGFAAAHPDGMIQCGIAEQNQLEVAAAMANEGFTTFAPSYATFITARVVDQIRVLLGTMESPVILVGVSAGLESAILGSSHTSLEDVGTLRQIPNMCVLSPSDQASFAAALRELAANPRPAYVRMNDGCTRNLHANGVAGVIGHADVLLEPAAAPRVVLLSCGTVTAAALDAASELAATGIPARVVDVPSIKPLPDAALEACAGCELVVTVEEHTVIGGLGGAIAERMCDTGAGVPLLRLGTPDYYLEADLHKRVLERSGLDAAGIVRSVTERLGRL